MPQVNEFSWTFLLLTFFFYFMTLYFVVSPFYKLSINKGTMFDLYYFDF